MTEQNNDPVYLVTIPLRTEQATAQDPEKLEEDAEWLQYRIAVEERVIAFRKRTGIEVR